MIKARHILYPLIAIPTLIILIWLIVIPSSLIQDKIEAALSDTGNKNTSITVMGLSKKILPGLHADSIDITIDEKEALSITDISIVFSPSHLIERQFAFTINGKTAGGDINGTLKLPSHGSAFITGADLSKVPYLKRFGIGVKGTLSSEIRIVDQTIKLKFEVPDLGIGDSSTVIPLLSTFRKLQGSMDLYGDTLNINSISLEGDKGYARLAGDIKNNNMDLSLELMPLKDSLNAVESMAIGKYIVSPGYYVVPIRGRLP